MLSFQPAVSAQFSAAVDTGGPPNRNRATGDGHRVFLRQGEVAVPLWSPGERASLGQSAAVSATCLSGGQEVPCAQTITAPMMPTGNLVGITTGPGKTHGRRQEPPGTHPGPSPRFICRRPPTSCPTRRRAHADPRRPGPSGRPSAGGRSGQRSSGHRACPQPDSFRSASAGPVD